MTNFEKYKYALDKLENIVNPQDWILNSEDFQRVVAVFDRMLSRNLTILNPDEISHYLESKGIDSDISMSVQKVYEVLESQRNLQEYPEPFSEYFWNQLGLGEE